MGKQATSVHAEWPLQGEASPAVTPAPIPINRNQDPIPSPTSEASERLSTHWVGPFPYHISQARGALQILLLMSVVLQTGRTLSLACQLRRCPTTLRTSPLTFLQPPQDFPTLTFPPGLLVNLVSPALSTGMVSVLP